MAKLLVRAVHLAIISGGTKDLEFEDQLRVAKAMQILAGLPDRFDEIKQSEDRGTNGER